MSLTTVAIPPVVFIALLLTGMGIFAICRKRKKKGNPHVSAEAQRTSCWKPIKDPFARYPFNEKEMKRKLDLITGDMTNYQQPFTIGTGTVMRKGSTLQPMDTDSEEARVNTETSGHYNCPHCLGCHEYTLHLMHSEPQYATPLWSGTCCKLTPSPQRAASESPSPEPLKNTPFPLEVFLQLQEPHRFKAIRGQQAPGLCVVAMTSLLSAVSCTAETHPLNHRWMTSRGNDGYSAPRNGLAPLNQMAMTAL